MEFLKKFQKNCILNVWQGYKYAPLAIYRYFIEYTAQKNEEILNGKLHFLCSDNCSEHYYYILRKTTAMETFFIKVTDLGYIAGVS